MFGQFIINGLITGVLYSLLAIGFALVYNTTKIFHVAASAVYVFAAYAFWFISNRLGLPIWLGISLSLVLTMLLSLMIEVVVYRPLTSRKSSLNVAMISSIGVMTVIVNLLAMIFGNDTKVISEVIPTVYTFGDIVITVPQMLQAVVGSIAIIAFLVFISRSSWGIRLRAVSCDDVLYSTLGSNVNSSRVVVFLLSGAFIALAGCLTVYDVGLDPHMGMNVLINAMVAMIIGGVGRFGTCVAGGMILGILQSLVVFQFSSNWQNAITFLVLLIFLFLRPQGLAGYKQRTV
jgi:branched-chain amino acid transport system permease protein